jgi:hypothetical protein
MTALSAIKTKIGLGTDFFMSFTSWISDAAYQSKSLPLDSTEVRAIAIFSMVTKSL